MHVLIRVQAPFHQSAGLAAAGQVSGNTCGFLGIGGRDNLIGRHVNLRFSGNLADLLSRGFMAIETILFPANRPPRSRLSVQCFSRPFGLLNNLLGEERSRRRRAGIVCERAARRLELVPSLIKRCRQNMSCFIVEGCFPE